MDTIRKQFRFISVCLLAGILIFIQCSVTGESDEDFFTLIVLPDTQNYTDSSFDGKPEYFYQQTKWIRDNKEELNIVIAIHEGDIVQNHERSPGEWEIADKAFKTIDNEVPYILCLGNHDIASSGDNNSREIDERYTLLNNYFPPARFINNPLYSGNFGPDKEAHFRERGKSDNYYLFFEAAGIKFLIISLEFKTRDETLLWANQVVAKYPDRQCIMVTHGYLDTANKRITMDNYKMTGNSGQEMWDTFISGHDNIFLVLCGHVLGEALRSDHGKNGNVVHQVLADYQNDYVGGGGNGYLRIMKFIPEQDRIDVETYSPVLDNYIATPRSQFSLEYPMESRLRAKTGS